LAKGIFFKLLTVLFLLSTGYVSGQPERPLSRQNLMVEGRIHYGYLMSHHLELDIFRAHYPAFEFSIQKGTYGKNRWEAMYAYPIIGVAAWGSQLGGFKEIGSAIAVYPFVDFPLFGDQSNGFNFRLGVGLGYLTNKFDAVNNYKNFAIGSHINACGSLYFEYRYKPSGRLSLSASFGLTHFSNGSTKTPNYGLNIITANVGIAYFLHKSNPYLDKKILPELYPYEFDGRKYINFELSASVASKDMTQQYGKRFAVYAAFFNIMKQVSYKSKWGLGLDATYDNSDRFILEKRGFEVTNDFQILKTGFNIAYELLISKMTFMFNAGIYLSGKEKSEGDFYQRLTVKYKVLGNIFANLVLSVHLGRAEYVGIGLGYGLDVVYKRKIKHKG
jgi:hypothetical protein